MWKPSKELIHPQSCGKKLNFQGNMLKHSNRSINIWFIGQIISFINASKGLQE